MGISLKAEEERKDEKREWLLILAYIGAKQTQDAGFRTLFEKLLTDERHPYRRQAKMLSMLYDFTPLQAPSGEDAGAEKS